MSKKNYVVLFAVVIGLLLPLSLYAEDTHDLQGRDVAELGKKNTLSGVLSLKDGEWYLNAKEETYLLHLGRMRDEAEKVFKKDLPVVVKGFVHNEHIAPITVKANGKTFSFWTEDGRPVWAGRGDGKGRRGTPDRDGQGRGQNRS